MKNPYSGYKVWFVTGSQHLYGEETLKQVSNNSQEIVAGLNSSGRLPAEIVFKGTATQPNEILKVCREANNSSECAGLVFWMHTFSPAKMWIAGLRELTKPFVHLHTQFNREIPWDTIDMDFMNLNQSAHGGREFGFMVSRMRKYRHVIVGHWKDEEVQRELGDWMRVAAGVMDCRSLKVARFGDNMRSVAVTEGDKVAAEEVFGYSVDGYGVGDLTAVIDTVTEAEADRTVQEYHDLYTLDPGAGSIKEPHPAIREEARIEVGMRRFLEEGGYSAFTTTFEDLHGLNQLPGFSVQRLMADGYGFGAEGDWKTAALTRTLKVTGYGQTGGTSFMEDYTYDFGSGGGLVLGAHMLEICPSIADGKPRLAVFPLGIGGKSDPARLIFTAAAGTALNTTVIDLGDRFRMVVNEVETVTPEHAMKKLPVARALWKPKPNLNTAAAAWIQAGGAHHSVYSQAVTAQQLEMLAGIWGIEMLLIDGETRLRDIMNRIRWNEAYYSGK